MQIKRMVLFVVVLIVAMGLMTQNVGAQRYSSSLTFDPDCWDSTALVLSFTDSITGAADSDNSPLFYWNNIKEGTISGVIECYIWALDSTVCDASDDAATPDTTKDSLRVTLYTAWNSQLTGNATGYARSGESVILSVLFSSMTYGTSGIQRNKFAIPSDSAIGDALYWRIIGYYTGPNNEDTVGIDYKLGVSMNAR